MKGIAVNGAVLKWIATISMLFDHIGSYVLGEIIRIMPPSGEREWLEALLFVCRMIGRLAFPLFVFLLLEAVKHTGNPFRYGVRLFLFGLLSEIPFDMVRSFRIVDLSQQNVFFTLFWGFLCIELLLWVEQKFPVRHCKRCWFVILLLCIAAAEFSKTDYSGIGVLFIVLMYCMMERTNLAGKGVAFLLSSIPLMVVLPTTVSVVVLFPVIEGYNGKRGKQRKYFFYLFYPVHLFLLVVIRYLLLS